MMFRKKITIAILTSIVVIGLASVVGFKLVTARKISACDFKIESLQAFDGTFGSTGSNYFSMKGVIRNNSVDRQYLKGMIAKVYDEDDVLVSDGYTKVEDWIEPGKGVPFNVVTTYRGDSKDTSLLNPDLYPWFSTCE